MLRGRVPAPNIFSGRKWASRQPEGAEPRHLMSVSASLVPELLAPPFNGQRNTHDCRKEQLMRQSIEQL